MSKEYSVLFIGNSMTYFHDLPTAIFAPMAESVGIDVKVSSVTAGGRFLWENLEKDDETARAVKAALAPDQAGVYDFVVLQEGMPDLYTQREKFHGAVRTLAGMIRGIGAEPALYARMGNQRGNPELPDDPECTYENVYNAIVEAHQTISEELDIPVAWAVSAAYELNDTGVDVDLYFQDQSHPGYGGSYAAALGVLNVLFGVDPTTVTYDGELTASQAALCREAVKRTQFLQSAKGELIAEFNALGIADMPRVTDLCRLSGGFVNLEYTLANGEKVKLLEDGKTYLGYQLEKEQGDRCYGLVADERYLLVCEYGCNGADPEIVVYKRR